VESQPVAVGQAETAPQPCEYHWPESEFYVSEKHKLVYCPIQKVACSSLKLWWAELMDGSSEKFILIDKYGNPCVDHFGLNARYKLLHHPSPGLGRRSLTEDDWLRMVFVRNPWARFVSAFVNKLVPVDPIAYPVLSEAHLRWSYQEPPRVSTALRDLLPWIGNSGREVLRISNRPWRHGRKAWKDELTFRHFVEYVASYDLAEDDIDLHWRPQYRFLGNVSFNFVGRFERIDEDFRAVAERLGKLTQLPTFNRSTYRRAKWRWRNYADCPLKRLRGLKSMPSYRQFYTPQLRERVAELYRRDIEQFGYKFND
jgi:Sulfotransferase family